MSSHVHVVAPIRFVGSLSLCPTSFCFCSCGRRSDSSGCLSVFFSVCSGPCSLLTPQRTHSVMRTAPRRRLRNPSPHLLFSAPSLRVEGTMSQRSILPWTFRFTSQTVCVCHLPASSNCPCFSSRLCPYSVTRGGSRVSFSFSFAFRLSPFAFRTLLRLDADKNPCKRRLPHPLSSQSPWNLTCHGWDLARFLGLPHYRNPPLHHPWSGDDMVDELQLADLHWFHHLLSRRHATLHGQDDNLRELHLLKEFS